MYFVSERTTKTGELIFYTSLVKRHGNTWMRNLLRNLPVSSYVTDTQALVKFMMGQKVINHQCHQAFLSADRGENIIIIPAIVLMEVLYLFEKNRIEIDLIQTEDLMKSKNYQFEPLSLEILKTASEINDIPELHDRLIAATAKYFDVPLITNDPVRMTR